MTDAKSHAAERSARSAERSQDDLVEDALRLALVADRSRRPEDYATYLRALRALDPAHLREFNLRNLRR